MSAPLTSNEVLRRNRIERQSRLLIQSQLRLSNIKKTNTYEYTRLLVESLLDMDLNHVEELNEDNTTEYLERLEQKGTCMSKISKIKHVLKAAVEWKMKLRSKAAEDLIVICPYCGAKAKLTESGSIHNRTAGKAYVCQNFPKCDSFAKAYWDDNWPMGELSSKELRDRRKEAYYKIYQLSNQGRPNLFWYKQIADRLKMPLMVNNLEWYKEDQMKVILRFLEQQLIKIRLGR